jgi:hypothetical protein
MLEFDDIQHFVLTRVPAVTGRYEFLSFQEPSQGRGWLAGIIDKVESAQAAAAGIEEGKRWVSVALTWTGLRALGLDGGSLASFPEDFRQGMPARWQVLGDTGPIIPIVGSAGLPARICTQSSFCLHAMWPNGREAQRSIRRTGLEHRA